MSKVQSKVQKEIETLHRFFTDWFNGAVPQDETVFASGFAEKMADRFVIIPPSGQMMSREQILEAVRQNYGLHTNFEISIRNVIIQWETADFILATYEEWQAGKGRLSTALLEMSDPIKWHHVHETWLPITE